MATNFFLKIAGIAGTSTDPKHQGEFELESFSFELSKSETTGPGGTAKPAFKDLAMVTRVSSASPKLFIACANGQGLASAQLRVRKATGLGVDYVRITLTDVRVSSYELAGTDGAQTPTEQFSLRYSKIKFEYLTQEKDGSASVISSATFDVKNSVQVP